MDFKYISFIKSPFFKFAWDYCRFSLFAVAAWQNPELGAVPLSFGFFVPLEMASTWNACSEPISV